MAPTHPHRFYFVSDDGTVTYTNDFEIAAVAKRDGSTLVIEPRTGEYTFDGDVQIMQEADDLDEDESDKDDEDDEGDEE